MLFCQFKTSSTGYEDVLGMPRKLEIHEVPTKVTKMAEETSSVSKVYSPVIQFSRDLIELELVLTCV